MKYLLLLILILSACDTAAPDVPHEPDDGELVCIEVEDGTLCAWTAPPTYEEDEDDE